MKGTSIAVFLCLPAGCCCRCRLPSACPVCRYGRGHTHTPLHRLLRWFLPEGEDGEGEETPLRTLYCSRELGRARARRVTPWVGVHEEGFIRRQPFINCFVKSQGRSAGSRRARGNRTGVKLWHAVQIWPHSVIVFAARGQHIITARAGNPLL